MSGTFGFGCVNKSETEKLVLPLPHYCVPVMIWLEWIALMLRFPDFVQFLNNWQKLDQNTANWRTKGNKSKLLACHLMVVNGLVVGNALLRIIGGLSKVSGAGAYIVCLIITAGVLTITSSLTEDTKVTCMLFSVSSSLRKVREFPNYR